MSRIGKHPVPVPAGVTVDLKGSALTVKGAKGELSRVFHPDMILAHENGEITVNRPSDESRHKALHGLTRTLVANMVNGVSKGFERKLSLVGVGFRAQAQGQKLNLQIGFSHPVVKDMPVRSSW